MKTTIQCTIRTGVYCSILALGLTLLPATGHAHGVHGETGDGSEALCAAVAYDDGEPMSYAGVEIFAPDAKLPFQKGRTDRNGYFCFRPDAPGRWKLIAQDEMGHIVRLNTAVSQEILEHTTRK